jgi:hypothetical protein
MSRMLHAAMQRLARVLALIVLGVFGCDGRALNAHDLGLPASADSQPFDGGRPDSPSDSQAAIDAGGGPECTIAVSWNACCPVAQPTLVSELSACTVPYLQPQPEGCHPPSVCPAMMCPPLNVSLRSRRVVGLEDGTCAWASECSQTSDCVQVIDLRFCCSDWQAAPQDAVHTDPCLYLPGKPTTSCQDRCADHGGCVSWPPQSYPSSEIDDAPYPSCVADGDLPPDVLKTCKMVDGA